MISRARSELAGIFPTALAKTAKMKGAVLGAGAFVMMLLSGSSAQAQCTTFGLNGLNASAPVVAQAAGGAEAVRQPRRLCGCFGKARVGDGWGRHGEVCFGPIASGK